MDVEVTAEAKDKRLNRMVAITVVILSVFTGVCGIKDGNLVQAMQQAQSDAVDGWNEYQATKTKLHIDRTARTQIALLASDAATRQRAAPILSQLDKDIAKYQGEIPKLSQQARGHSDDYNALNVHDDQFD